MPWTTSFSNLRRRQRGRMRGWLPHSLAPPLSTPKVSNLQMWRLVAVRKRGSAAAPTHLIVSWNCYVIVVSLPSPPEWWVPFQSCGGGEWPMTFFFRRDTRSLKGFLVTLALEGKIQTQTITTKGQSADRSVKLQKDYKRHHGQVVIF